MVVNGFDYIALGMRVRDCRQKLDMTQAQLARRTGVTSSFIGQIERGEKKASVETLVRLVEVLNTELDFLALGKKSRCSIEECPLYDDLARLVDSYH